MYSITTVQKIDGKKTYQTNMQQLSSDKLHTDFKIEIEKQKDSRRNSNDLNWKP